MTATLPAVLKVGGSLLDLPNLGARLAALSAHLAVPVACIAGGGTLVDVIRDWQVRHALIERTAHELAMHSLDVTARLLHELLVDSALCLSPDEVRSAWSRGRTAVIAPHHWFAPGRGWFEPPTRVPTGLLPQSWEVTSDTLAACVAIELEAHLVLLKSTDPPAGLPLVEWVQQGFVDAAFAHIAPHLRQLSWINLRTAGTVAPVDLHSVRGLVDSRRPADGEHHFAG